MIKKKLFNYVKTHPDINFDNLRKSLGVSSADLAKRYYEFHFGKKGKKPFTDEEDKLLLRYVKPYTDSNRKVDWNDIAKHFQGRSGPDLMYRHRTLKKKSIKTQVSSSSSSSEVEPSSSSEIQSDSSSIVSESSSNEEEEIDYDKLFNQFEDVESSLITDSDVDTPEPIKPVNPESFLKNEPEPEIKNEPVEPETKNEDTVMINMKEMIGKQYVIKFNEDHGIKLEFF